MVAAMVPHRWSQLLQGFALLAAALVLAGCGTLGPNAAPVVSVSAVPSGVVLAPPAPPSPVEIVTPPPTKPAAPPPAEAVPRADRISTGHPNLPYAIRGELYVPENSDVPMHEVGVASWYGVPFHGRIAASGERYDMNAMTAAHPTMPLPSYARVRNLANGREVVVRVNDRGPFRAGRIIDLSRAAARKLGFSGTTMVEVERLTHDDIRTGAWRCETGDATSRKRRRRRGRKRSRRAASAGRRWPLTEAPAPRGLGSLRGRRRRRIGAVSPPAPRRAPRPSAAPASSCRSAGAGCSRCWPRRSPAAASGARCASLRSRSCVASSGCSTEYVPAEPQHRWLRWRATLDVEAERAQRAPRRRRAAAGRAAACTAGGRRACALRRRAQLALQLRHQLGQQLAQVARQRRRCAAPCSA